MALCAKSLNDAHPRRLPPPRWRGQFAHNTNFTSVLPPHGGWAKWKSLGIDQSYLPLWLKDQGYNTYYVGKVREWV